MIRLDKLCIEKGLFSSRERAQEAIRSGQVRVNGKMIDKPSYSAHEDDELDCEVTNTYVSRAAYKLLGAFSAFSLDIEDKNCLDIGASTGGFTQVCLEKGAKLVTALDVGYDQLAPHLREDHRVEVMEKYNFRYAEKSWFQHEFDFFCSDVSFISLTLIIPAIRRVVTNQAEGILLIKPQFEAGPDKLNKHGVVKDKQVHVQVIHKIMGCCKDNGFNCAGICVSPLVGKDGNIEYLLHIVSHMTNTFFDIREVVNKAFE